MLEYTFLSLISVVLVIFLDQILGTKILFSSKFFLFWLIVILLQTVVDNYLNGRWWLGQEIVGPYGKQFFFGVKIWHTPLENYLFGFSLIGLNIVIFEFLKKPSLKDFNKKLF